MVFFGVFGKLIPLFLVFNSNLKLVWILNYRIFTGHGLELRVKGFMNFRNEMILPRHVRNLGFSRGPW